MKSKFCIFLLAVALVFQFFTAETLFAAQKNWLDISTTAISSSKFEDAAGNTELSQQITRINGTLPLPINAKNIVIFNATYQHHDLSWKNFQAQAGITEGDLPDNLQTAELALGLMHKISDSWSILGRIAGGIKSDFEDIDSRDMAYSSLLSVTRHYGKEKSLGIGLSYSDSFGSPSVFPVLQFKWASDNKWKFYGTLPLQAIVEYRINQRISTGLNAEVKGNQYRLTEKAPWNEAVLNYTEILVGPVVDFSLSKKAHIVLKGGIVTGQKIEFKDKDDTDKVLVEKELENSTFATIAFYVPF